MTVEGSRRGWLRRALWALIGAAAGVALGLLLRALLLQLGLAPAPARPRLAEIGPAVVAWLAVLGAVGAAFWRPLLRALGEGLLPRDLAPESARLVLLAAGIAVLAVVQYHVIAFLARDPTDLPSFLLAARAMAAGRDFYDPAVLPLFRDDPAAAPAVVFPYLYLPFFAVILRPLAALPLAAGHAAFLIFNALLWPLLIWLCLRLIDAPPRLRVGLAAVVLLVMPSFLPTIQTFHHGSPSLLVAVLVVGTFVLEREGRHGWAGALLAVAVLIKIVPAILIPYFLLRRRGRMLLWAAGVGVALLGLSVAVAGVGPHLHWLLSMMPGLASRGHTGTFFEPGCHPENQSLTGVLCRFLGEGSATLRWLPAAAGAGLAALAAVALWRRRSPEIDRLEGALCVVTILLVSTITWFHHMTLMLLPALTLVVEGAAGPGRRRLLVLAVGLGALVAVGFEFYLDPWPFLVANPLARTLRFQAMAACYAALVALLMARPRSAPPAVT
jgi:hypothetical protein